MAEHFCLFCRQTAGNWRRRLGEKWNDFAQQYVMADELVMDAIVDVFCWQGRKQLQTVNCRYGRRRDADISSIPQMPLCRTCQPFESIFSKLENIVFLLRRLSVAVDIFSLGICWDLREFIHVWCIQKPEAPKNGA